MGDLTKALLKHRAGVGVGMVLVGLIAAGVLSERRQHQAQAPEPAAEPDGDALPPVGRAGLFARIAAAHERRRETKTYRR